MEEGEEGGEERGPIQEVMACLILCFEDSFLFDVRNDQYDRKQ